MIERLLPVGADRVARIRFTVREDGDFRVDAPPEPLRWARRAVADRPWTWLRQVHGCTVIRVDRAGSGAGSEADASVTAISGAVLSVQTADCAPVVLANDGAVGVVHAGWRGVVAGVVPAAVRAMRELAEGEIRAMIGPLIRPRSYEFGETELAAVAAVAGDGVRSRTATGRPALDLAAAVVSSLDRAGVGSIHDLGLDTASPDFYSHRCRSEAARMAATVVLEPA